jgi:hypothetical protein
MEKFQNVKFEMLLKFAHDYDNKTFFYNVLKRLRRYEKRSDNYPLYEFESMSICEFAMLFEAH